MPKNIKWRRAKAKPKGSLSITDEKEYRGNDAAARWLSKNDVRYTTNDKPRKK